MLFELLLFIIALAVLVKSADYFTEAAEKIALGLGVPYFIIGVTIVAAGTSLPELSASIASVLNPDPSAIAIIAGNVIGSNVANIALILGLAIMLVSKKIDWDIMKVDLPLLLGSAFFIYFASIDGVFSFNEALLAFVFYGVYIAYSVSTRKKKERKEKRVLDPKNLVVMLGSCAGLAIGANYTVEAVVALAGILSIPSSLIAVSAVAIGTSLPELIVSITAARRGNIDLAVGNVTGSNIFNALIVLGVPALMAEVPFDTAMRTIGIPFSVAITLVLVVIGADREFGKYEGAMLLVLYALFLGMMFGWV